VEVKAGQEPFSLSPICIWIHSDCGFHSKTGTYENCCMILFLNKTYLFYYNNIKIRKIKKKAGAWLKW
jgi:hypothetical protein